MNAKEIIDRFGSVKRCADAFNVSASAVYQWNRLGEIPSISIKKAPNDTIKFLNSGLRYESEFVGPLVPKWWRKKSIGNDARFEAMKTRYQSGQTLQQIGDFYKITRERVRQILRKNGVDNTGGIHRRKAHRVAKNAARLDAKSYAKYGCSWVEYIKLREICGKQFKEQRRSANMRAVGWKLNISDWWRIWQDSGKWSERGRGKNKYCMARLDDAGAYEIGNVHIVTNSDNMREWRCSGRRANSGDRGGVYMLLPGYSRPWIARHGQKNIGYFKTEEEARAAKEKFVCSHA